MRKLVRLGRLRNPAPLPLWQWADRSALLHPCRAIERDVARRYRVSPTMARLIVELAGLGGRRDG
jgi:hypothetical protein